MKFVMPVAVRGAVFVASSVPEDDAPPWSAETTYAAGAEVISSVTHRIYESAQAENVGHDPAEGDEAWWIDIGPTNRWAMFDDAVGTQTSAASPLAAALAPGICNALVLLDLDAISVRVVVTDGDAGPTVYDRTFALPDAAEIFDWYDYFFADFDRRTTLIVDDLPPYRNARITVTIDGPGAVKCGSCIVGNLVALGRTLTSPQVGIVDYSKNETDDFGVTKVIPRGFAKRIEARFILESKRTDYTAKKLAAIRATPVVWVTGNGSAYESLVTYGYYRDWNIDIAYPTFSEATIEIRGLT